MTFSKPSTVLNATGAYTFKKGVANSATNYIDNNVPNMLDKTGDNLAGGGGISGTIDILSGGALQLQTGAAFNMLGSSSMTVDGTSQITFNNSSNLSFNSSGNIIIGSSGSLLCGGTLNITSGGTFNLQSTGNMHIKNGANFFVDSGGTETISSGGVVAVAGGANVNYASGSNLNLNSGAFMTATSATTTFTGNLVIMNGGVTQIFSNGSNSFLTIGTSNTFNNHGTMKTDSWPIWNTPITRQSCMRIDHGAVAQGAANWLNVGTGLQNTNSSNPQIIGTQTLEIPLTRLHNGSTLASVFIAFIVGTSHSGVPQNLPTFTVFRYNTLSNPTSVQYLNSVAVQSPANPGSGAAWYNSGNAQFFQYICNQNNVIDNTTYCYAMSVADESGTNSLGGNFYLSVTAENQIINDLSWNI